ncbi:MAG: hypothetical protein IPP94_05020 [Ignavibacteria bacterium]|nr:hypothetical protein [Ignavibacteria bacterium]
MGDVNRDSIPDLFINTGIGTTRQTWMIFGTKPGIIDRNNFVRLEGWGTLAKGDVNGDGLQDLLVQTWFEGVTMYPGCSTCPFTIDTVPAWRISTDPTEQVNILNFGNYIAIGDLNGDGLMTSPLLHQHGGSMSGHGCTGKIFVYFGGSSKVSAPRSDGGQLSQ